MMYVIEVGGTVQARANDMDTAVHIALALCEVHNATATVRWDGDGEEWGEVSPST